jgi:hypothetical protein
MPTFRHQTIVEISRGLKAFLGLVVGVTRGQVPELRSSGERPRKLAQNRTESGTSPRPEGAVPGRKVGQINPENIVWILGSPRTGSTWLGEILGEPRGHALWKEPFFGVVLGFRNNLANRGYVDSGQFVLGEPHRDVWIRSMRNLFLDVGRAKFPNISPRHYLLIKEPNGSLSAPLIMEAFPESKLVFLVRDPRDVVASLLDAAKKGSWYGYDRYEASVDEFVEQLAKNYVANVSAVREAYEGHPEGGEDPGPLRGPAGEPAGVGDAHLREAARRGGPGAAGAGRREALVGEHPGGQEGGGEVPPQGDPRGVEGGPHARAGRDSGEDNRPAARRVLPGLIPQPRLRPNRPRDPEILFSRGREIRGATASRSRGSNTTGCLSPYTSRKPSR